MQKRSPQERILHSLIWMSITVVDGIDFLSVHDPQNLLIHYKNGKVRRRRKKKKLQKNHQKNRGYDPFDKDPEREHDFVASKVTGTADTKPDIWDPKKGISSMAKKSAKTIDYLMQRKNTFQIFEF